MLVQIRGLHENETPPMDLLLSADLSREHIEDYMSRGCRFIFSLAAIFTAMSKGNF